MRFVEALAGGFVAAIGALLIAARFEFGGDRVLIGAVVFLPVFLAVLLRSDRPIQMQRRR